jgi:hypothetical protein
MSLESDHRQLQGQNLRRRICTYRATIVGVFGLMVRGFTKDHAMFEPLFWGFHAFLKKSNFFFFFFFFFGYNGLQGFKYIYNLITWYFNLKKKSNYYLPR